MLICELGGGFQVGEENRKETWEEIGRRLIGPPLSALSAVCTAAVDVAKHVTGVNFSPTRSNKVSSALLSPIAPVSHPARPPPL